ncbi:MAG: GNAT family N-acetyltransferase [Firmicutes bacterium]|nr:GNAT family N-acetyltransferase [Bacillota bacterium]
MTIKIYTLEQRQEWDQVVRSFFEYDAYWLSGYVKAFQIHGDGEPLLFYFENDSTRGINVVMKRDIAGDKYFSNILPKGKYFDFSTPYGYGGWIIEGENNDELFNEYELWCQNNNIISEFVRFHPVLKNHIYSERVYEVVPLGNTVTMDLSSPEIIWANITSKNRNMIRKATKNGIKIFNGRFPQIYREFKNIYNLTMDKDNADSYYYFDQAFYESLLEDLPSNSQVFYAELDDRIIAASIMLSANGRMNYHLSGALKEYSNLAPTNLLLYKAALWGYANNCKTLYLGGGVGSEEDSLFKFKKAFYRKDDLDRFYIGKKIFLVKEYKELINIKNIENTNYFPQYRA